MARRMPTLERNLSGRGLRQGSAYPLVDNAAAVDLAVEIDPTRLFVVLHWHGPRAPEIDQAKYPAPRVTMPFAIWRPRLILRAASGGEISMRSSLPAYVKLWFAADLFLALFPPLH